MGEKQCTIILIMMGQSVLLENDTAIEANLMGLGRKNYQAMTK